MPHPSPSDAELISHYRLGTLVDVLEAERDPDRPGSLRSRLIALHNGGQLDLLAALETPAFDALTGHHFFSVQRVYCGAIPHLRAPVPGMIQAVGKLVIKGGQDMAAGFPHNAFKEWLQKDLARAEDIIASADKNELVDKQAIAIALETMNDAEWACRFIGKGAGDLRLAAISALGRIRPRKDGAARDAMATLLPFCGGACDEDTRFVAINAIFTFLRQAPAEAKVAVPAIVAAVAGKPSTESLYAVVEALWLQEKLFDRASIEAVLRLARGVDFTKKGLVDVLDGALQHMLGTPERDLALDFLTDVLAAERGLTLDSLDAVCHRLASEPRAVQFPLAARWFLSANRRLCEAMAHVLTSGQERDEPFDASMAGMGLSGSEQIVICHKAIGFILLQPVVSASMVVAALRAADASVEGQLIELLVYPILINYRGAAREYLDRIRENDIAYKAVRHALARGDAYAKGARIETPIKELWPSDYQRNLAAMKRYDQGRAIQKLAHEHSILGKLAHRSTLLYGHKSMSFVGGADKEPVTMELKEMGVELPMPRLDLIDPVGLDWLLRVFRSSKPK